jgi:hypothetical protein
MRRGGMESSVKGLTERCACRRGPIQHRPMCIDGGYATAWETITASRRFQHRVEVFFDQILEHLGMTFAQYRALEAIAADRGSTSPSSPVASACRDRPPPS